MEMTKGFNFSFYLYASPKADPDAVVKRFYPDVMYFPLHIHITAAEGVTVPVPTDVITCPTMDIVTKTISKGSVREIGAVAIFENPVPWGENARRIMDTLGGYIGRKDNGMPRLHPCDSYQGMLEYIDRYGVGPAKDCYLKVLGHNAYMC